MSTPLRVLIVEDSEDDAILVLRELRRGGYNVSFERVDTAEAMETALEQQEWDIVLSDYSMPHFSMPAALTMVKEKGLELPFIIVSGAIGEEAAVAAMRDGARDYVMKSNLARLVPVVERELSEAEVRREHERMQQALKDSQELYSALVSNLTDAVFLFRGNTIAWCNDRVEELYGYPKEELLGKNSEFFYPSGVESSEFTGGISKALQKSGIFRGTSRFQKINGETACLEYSLSQIPGKVPIELIAVARDITRRKEAEVALRQSEEYYRALIENAQDVIMVLNSDGSIRYESPSFERVLGYKSAEQGGPNPFELVHPDDVEGATRTFAQLLQNTGAIVHSEVRALNKEGSWRTLEVVGKNLNDNPAVRGIVANFHDITERKIAEESLRRSEEYYRAIIENAQDVIVVLNRDGTVRYESPSIRHVLGYTPENMIGMNSFDNVHPEDMPKAAELFAQLIQDPGSIIHTEIRGQCEDGSWRTIEVIGQNLLDDPAVAGIVANFHDITEQKKAEAALQESEAHYRLLAENVTDIIATLDMDLRVTYISPSVTRQLGFNVEEVIGIRITDVLPSRSLEAVRQSLEEEMDIESLAQKDLSRSRTLEVELYRKNGSTIWVEIEATFLRNQEEQAVGILAVARDTSERQRAEGERKKLEHQLQLAGRLAAVGELAAGVAHELNNPLAAIQAFAQFLSENGDMNESIKGDVITIYKEAQRATRITTNLLRFARRNKPEEQLLSINEVIEKSLEIHGYRLKVNNIDVLMELNPDLPMIMADPDQMHQVFVNIITNAEQALTEAKGGGRLLIKTQIKDDTIQIDFTDNGPGISEDNLKSIFDPFFTTKEVGKGTGLGLSICYGIVNEHGGHMYARNNPGKGATFVIEIPVVSKSLPIPEKFISVEPGQVREGLK